MKRRATMSDRNATTEIEARAREVGRRLVDFGVSPRNVGRRLLRAWSEGRLHPDLAREIGIETGEHECVICGMRHWTEREAERCCDGLVFCQSIALADPYARQEVEV